MESSFDETGVNVEVEGKEMHIDADTCVNAFGNGSNSAVAEDIKKAYPYITRTVGDCVRVNKVGEAIRAGFFATNVIE